MRQTRGCWVGREVEGAYAGIETLFIRAAPEDEDTWQGLFAEPRAVFILHEAIEIYGWDVVDRVLRLATIGVTVQVRPAHLDYMPAHLRPRVRLQVVLNGHPALRTLTAKDEIAIHAAPFTVCAFPVQAGAWTQPSDYDTDRPLWPSQTKETP